MNKKEYENFGDIIIEDTGFGFVVRPENEDLDDGCDGGCSGCGH